MKIEFTIVFVSILACVFANTDHFSNLDIDEYTRLAIEELHEINRNKGERGFMGITGPKCNVDSKNDSVQCCIGMMWMGHKRSICLNLSFNVDKLLLHFGLSFDGTELIGQTIAVGELCVPLPGMLRKLGICIDLYYLHIDTNKPRVSFEGCFLIKLAGILEINFNCMNLDKNGKFTHRHDQQPDGHRMFEVSLEDGTVKFNVHNPIPPEVMEQLGQGWKQFENGAKDAVDKTVTYFNGVGQTIKESFERSAAKIKHDVVKQWNTVSKTFQNLGHTIAGWFG